MVKANCCGIVLVLLAALAVPGAAQEPASWTRAVEPVRIAGNIYYVGTEELGAYLIATKEGLILLDAPMEQNARAVLAAVRKLGFDPAAIRILLNSHAHYDHIGGMAAIRKATKAKLYLSAAEAELAARGGKKDFAFGDRFPYPPVQADVIVQDGQTVRLGEAAMTAWITPGHTRGCTTWRTKVEEDGKLLDVVFVCSLTAPGYTLVNNERYPEIFDDYRRSFARLRTIDPDVLLANHASFFGLAAKLAARRERGPNPFIVRGELGSLLERSWEALERERAKQLAK